MPGVEMPMSPLMAWTLCCSTLGCPAFQPKRPSASAWRPSSHTRFGRPEMPSPSARSEEHTSELQSLMRISYAVFCLKKKNKKLKNNLNTQTTTTSTTHPERQTNSEIPTSILNQQHK